MFAHFMISTLVIFFVYKAFLGMEKIKTTTIQNLVASLVLTVCAFALTLVKVPAIGGVIVGSIILFLLQKSYVKDNKKNALIVLKTSVVLVLVIILILVASGFILR